MITWLLSVANNLLPSGLRPTDGKEIWRGNDGIPIPTSASNASTYELSGVDGDEVTRLPGWSKPLKSKIFSGFVELEKGMHEHYVIFESEGNPATDPVIIWMNGGPGASSLFGAFTEVGPYFLSNASLETEEYKKTGVPTFFDNPTSWTRLATLIVLNSPPPVGYSYCDKEGPSGDGYSCGVWNDERVAKINSLFVDRIFERYPRYGKQDLYIIGESYAGIYIPMYAKLQLSRLKGIALGDACIGNDPCMCLRECGRIFDLEFFYGHGQVSHETYSKILKTCTKEELDYGMKTDACKESFKIMDTELGAFFEYDLYDQCYAWDMGSSNSALREEFLRNDNTTLSAARRSERRSLSSKESSGEKTYGRLPQRIARRLKATAGTYPCGGTDAVQKWARTPQVKQAFGATPDANFFLSDNGKDMDYRYTVKDVTATVRDLILAGMRVLVFDGDADPALNSFHAQNWTSHLGFEVAEPWRPWTLDGKMQVAGYTVKYKNNFDFTTIRGAGHMVPMYQPDAAFVLIQNWLKQEELPRFKPTISQLTEGKGSDDENERTISV